MPVSQANGGFSTILYETSDDHVATITLNRPEVLNAFDRTMCHEVRDAWRMVKEDPAVHAVVLRAAGETVWRIGTAQARATNEAQTIVA